MATPAPVRECDQLFNRLIRLPAEQQDEIREIEWRLRKLEKKLPGDPAISVARMTALLRSGQAEAAHALVDALWAARYRLDNVWRSNFAALLASLGLYERAAELVDNLPATGSVALNVGVTCLLALGNITAATGLARSFGASAFANELDGLSDALRAEGLYDLFPGHQQTVNTIVRGQQVFYEALPIWIAGEGTFELSVTVCVAGERPVRRALADKIDDALESYYRSNGRHPSSYVPLITTLVCDHRALVPSIVGS